MVITIHDLPQELLLKIFDNLEPVDLCRAKRVCTEWSKAAMRKWKATKNLDVAAFEQVKVHRNTVNMQRRIQRMMWKMTGNKSTNQLQSVFIDYRYYGIPESNEILRTIAKKSQLLKELTVNAITFSHVSRGVMEVAKTCQELRKLSITGTATSSDESAEFNAEQRLFDIVKVSTKLENLRLVLNHSVTGYFLTFASATITTITLTECLELTDEALRHITQRCTQLTNLSILYFNGNAHITDNGFKNFIEAECRHTLERLELSGIFHQATSESLVHLSNCRALKYLSVVNTNLLSDSAISAISYRCSQLERLWLANFFHTQVYLVSDRAVTNIATYCKKLKHICIEGHSDITDLSLEAILNHGTLESVGVMGSAVTDLGLLKLIMSNLNLKEINVILCRNITAQVRPYIEKVVEITRQKRGDAKLEIKYSPTYSVIY